MKKCPYCGTSVNEGDVFCTECGKRIDDVTETVSFEPTKTKCPHCGASVNVGDIFCTECGKKIDETSTIITETSVNTDSENVAETPQTEEKEEKSEYHYEYEPKTWRDYTLPIFGGIFIILLLGASWWYWDSSNKRVAREKAIADSLEIVRQDSIKVAKLREEKERKVNERKLRLEACKNYVEKFYNEYERTDNQDEYLRQHCTYKALNTLKEEYPYDCDNHDCLATWIFFYAAGTDAEFVKREFVPVDENSCRVNNITNDGYTYSVIIGLVVENGQFMVDKIITNN